MVYIKKIVYDESTVEGRSRAFFISKFDGSQVRPRAFSVLGDRRRGSGVRRLRGVSFPTWQGVEPLRRFIDAFHNHIMETRKTELERLAVQTALQEDPFRCVE